MENLKDQQIKQHAETIESLSKQVESLEKELQKCLEPGADSDTERTNEDDDSHRFHNSVKYWRMVHGATEIIQASFGHLSDGTYSPGAWRTFRNFLVDSASVDPIRTTATFKWGLQLVIYIIEALDAIKGEADVDEYYNLHKGLAEKFLDSARFGSDTEIKAVETLRHCLKEYRVELEERYDLQDEDLVELDTPLTTIAMCQQIALEASKERK